MHDHFAKVAQAFSRKALVYDTFGVDHEHLTRMRHKVYAHVLSFLKPGDHILELNAGTGTDAVFFAQRGYRVHTTDLSAGMVSQIEDKISHYGLQENLSAQRCSFTKLGEVQDRQFQYVFSNFGGLNCIPDLTLVTGHLPGLLVPGGIATWVVMPPICPWELASILRGDAKTALRRLSPGGTMANVEDVQFMTYYFTPRQVVRAFGNQFRPLKLEGLSVFTPTADAKHFPRRFPSLYRLLTLLDDRLSHLPPFNRWGDFFILTLRYCPL